MSTSVIPAELRARAQWIAWRWEQRGDKRTKLPINPKTGGLASATDPATWTDHLTALGAAQTKRLAGPGFVFSPDDPFTGVDLDDCVDEGGWVADRAQEIVDELDSYTELTPSETGLHIWVRGTLPEGGRRRKGPVEMYSQARFFTVTGDHLDGTPTTIEDRQAELEALHARLFGEPEPQRKQPPPTNGHGPDDETILQKAFAAKNGADIIRLWTGDTSAYPSASEADAALCAHLAFWTGPDPDRIDWLFRQSRLYREKWERAGYRDRTISGVLSKTTEYYEWHRPTLEMGANGHRPSEAEEPVAVSHTDFRAYMPEHKYIFVPNRELWPASSVNTRVKPVPTGEEGRKRQGDPPAASQLNRPASTR